ncbi:MAG: GxxExxY protein [Candidatus Marinimicrobia bacterium]|jgi:GxxExxY protein|nr:GxxExxY protein [Candidatus Neomarinimicrobiota bacterium]MDD5710081.1 GxxExxY protein [Candidatus Neomarinimicrobiota bacterium]MDX9778121.1 GxxExxY protein [bacterium]
MLFETLTRKIIGAAFTVYNKMGFGYLEKVYEKCMLIELEKIDGIDVKCQCPIKVEYEGVDVGDFVADFIVENEIVIEIKSVHHVLPIHEMQLVNYLNASGLDLGLLINFGESKVDIRRKLRKLPGNCNKAK